MIYVLILVISGLALVCCLYRDWQYLAAKKFPRFTLVVWEIGLIFILAFVAVMDVLTKGA
jgi:hypothetical protein